MGLVTDDLSSLLSDSPERTPLLSGWLDAVHRFQKWLRTTLAAHGEHGDGLRY